MVSPKRTPSISCSLMTDSKIPPPNPENLIKWVPVDYLPCRQSSKGENLWPLPRSIAEVKYSMALHSHLLFNCSSAQTNTHTHTHTHTQTYVRHPAVGIQIHGNSPGQILDRHFLQAHRLAQTLKCKATNVVCLTQDLYWSIWLGALYWVDTQFYSQQRSNYASCHPC